MTQPFVPGYGPSIPAPTPGVDVQDEGVPIPGPTQTLNFVGAGVSAAPGVPGTVDVTIPGGGGAVTGWPNALLFENPAGLAPTTDAALVAAPVDAFGRPQIWDYRLNAGNGTVWRQGQWVADGDPGNVIGEGFVSYGPAGGVQDAANGMFARVKYDRFGLRRIIGGVDIGYAWRVDPVEMTMRDDTGALTFQVDRASGNAVLAGTLEMYGGGPGTEVAYPIPTGPQDSFAVFANSPELGYSSALRFETASRIPTFYGVGNYPRFDNTLGYTVFRFYPDDAPAGAPWFGTGNGFLWKAQNAAPGSGLAGGDMGLQAGNGRAVGGQGGTAFLQAGGNPDDPAFRGVAEMRHSGGGEVVSVGGPLGAALGFFGPPSGVQQTVVGSRGGNAALASLLTALANYGLIIDSTTP